MTSRDDEQHLSDEPSGWLTGIDVHHCVCVLFIAVLTAFMFPRQTPLREISLLVIVAPLIAAVALPFTFVALAPWDQGLLATLRYLRDNFLAGVALVAVIWLVRFPIVVIASWIAS